MVSVFLFTCSKDAIDSGVGGICIRAVQVRNYISCIALRIKKEASLVRQSASGRIEELTFTLQHPLNPHFIYCAVSRGTE